MPVGTDFAAVVVASWVKSGLFDGPHLIERAGKFGIKASALPEGVAPTIASVLELLPIVLGPLRHFVGMRQHDVPRPAARQDCEAIS